MADSSSSSKLVYFVIFPLILLSGLVIILNQKPSSWLPSSTSAMLKKGVQSSDDPLPPAAAPPVADQPLPMMENGDRKKFSDLEVVEAGLARARATIQEAQWNNETSYDHEYVPTGPMYRDAVSFHRSYLEMEKSFKIYAYEDGEPPLFHYSKSLGILGIEGILIHQIEISRFLTEDPRQAHVYFVPISMQSISTYAYVRHNRAWSPLQNIARDYVDLISTKYPYWNRTLGHDHFFLACHDWAPTISRGVPHLYENLIRVLCNANKTEGFKPSTDVSMPEIYLPDGTMDGLIGGPGPSERSVLVFYAGGIHGDIRQMLMDHWKDKDPDFQI